MLNDKRILLISPQPWGDIHVSKHHYAIELAKRGNAVVFVDPLKFRLSNVNCKLRSLPAAKGLQVATVTLPIPSFWRFKWRRLYDYLIDFFAARMARQLGGFDIVWCFDPNHFHNLKVLAPLAVYHPVDPVTE